VRTALSDYLEIWGFQDDAVIFSDGSLGMGLELKPRDASCWSSPQIEDFSQKLSQFLNSLPIECDIQFIQDITSGNLAVIQQHEAFGEKCTSEVVNDLTRARCARLNEIDSSGGLPKHTLKVFIRKRPQSGLLERPKFFSKTKLFQPIASEKLQFEILTLLRVKDDLCSQFESLGLTPYLITSHDVAKLIYSQWNPARTLRLQEFDPDDVRYSLVYSDVAVSDRGFSIQGLHYRVLSLKSLPDQTFATMAQSLRALPFDSRLALSIHVPNQQKELESLQLQRRVAYSMVVGRKTGVSDLESEAKFRDLETLLEQMVAQGERVFHVGFQVVLRAKSESELDELVSQALQKIRELSGADAMEESLAAFDLFAATSIPNARALERVKRMKTSNLCDLLPVYGPWQGHPEAKILLRSRLGSLVSFDIFSSELSNSNQIVSGGSGSGKSFLSNILLMQMLKENPKVFIVDIGGSYKKLCENFDGQYIPLGIESDISINPFDLKSGETAPPNEKIKFLLSLVEIMTKEDDAAALGKLERAEIEMAIQQVYELKPQPKLSDLKELLLKHTDLKIARIGKILGSWCGNTPYGRFVDRPTSLSLTRSIVCFDLKGLDSLADLQAACLFIITDFVWREVQADRTTMKFLIFDESWKLLENEAGATFIASVFRTFRKYMASAIAISQNIDDFAESRVANAILPNASIKWVLKQKGADQERLKSVLSLNENEAELVASLHQERGSYSEAFLIAEDQRAVVLIESTPLEYWLATTDSRDLGKIDSEKLAHSKLTNLEVLKRLAQRYPRGVSYGKEQ